MSGLPGRRGLGAGGVVVLLMSLYAGAGSAQPSASDKALAETLFQDAKRLFADGKKDEACDKLAESHRLDPRTGTLLNLATCHEEQGKTATAWIEFTDLAGQAARAGQRDREKLAREHATALDKRLSRVTVERGALQPDAEVRLDGRPLSPAALGTAIPLDPGEHTLDASAPGHDSWTQRLHVAAGPSEARVTLPALAATAPPPPSAPPPAVPARASSDANRPPPDTSNGGFGARRIMGVALLGVGAASIAVGTVFGVRTFSKKSDSDTHCKKTLCDEEGLSLRDEAENSATISTIAFAAGAGAAIAGVILLVAGGGGDKARAARERVRFIGLAADPQTVSVHARGTF